MFGCVSLSPVFARLFENCVRDSKSRPGNRVWVQVPPPVVFSYLVNRISYFVDNLETYKNMKLKSIIVCMLCILLLPVIFVLSWYLYNYFLIGGKTIQIEDVTNKTTITLTTEAHQKQMTTIGIILSGDINGSAAISVYNEVEQVFEIDIEKGKVNINKRGGCYTDKCTVEYEPLSVSSGKLQIKYKFFE